MFILRKMISILVLPLNICLLTVISGLLLIFFTRRQRVGKTLICVGVLILLFFSLLPVSNRLVGSLELRYSPLSTESIKKSNIQWIVVLGGGHNSSRPEGTQLSPSSLARLTEAIRIYRAKPGRKFILSGGAVFDPLPNSKALFATAKMFGVNEKDMILESESRDTEDEARLIAPTLKREPFYLVTSASHMPRSMALFQKQGTHPIPAPTDFAFQSNALPVLLRFLPSSTAFQQSERALREYLGITWSRLRSKAD